MTADDFRRIALSMPDASESAHMGHPDFRVYGKIFATLGSPDEGLVMVKLTPEQQQEFVASEPATFSPVKGGWGRQGSTQVSLERVTEEAAGHAITMAWRNIPAKAPRPKKTPR